MAHNCKHPQAGKDVCPEHILTKEGIRFRFKKQMKDTINQQEIKEWYQTMFHSMLPIDNSVPLDDRPHWYIEKIAKGGVTP